jgi:hypothetical protein
LIHRGVDPSRKGLAPRQSKDRLRTQGAYYLRDSLCNLGETKLIFPNCDLGRVASQYERRYGIRSSQSGEPDTANRLDGCHGSRRLTVGEADELGKR